MIYDPLEFVTKLPEIKEEVANLVLKPIIFGPDIAIVDSDITLIASGSLTAFPDAEIDYYKWFLPDNTTFQGSKLSYHVPNNLNIGNTFNIFCLAVDTLGNKSSFSKIEIKIVASLQYPVIESLIWDNDNHEDHGSYDLTIIAYDPQGQDLGYKVICDNDKVIINQDVTNLNIFHITYGNYKKNITIVFTAIVYNEDNLADYEDSSKDVFDIDPKITFINWNNNDHYELTINDLRIFAEDPRDQDLTYKVICDNEDVLIIQDELNDNIFHVTYPDYASDTIVTYTITVTNEDLLTDVETDSKLVQNVIMPDNRGLFGGGYGGGYQDIIDYVTISTPGDATDFGDLSIAKNGLASTSNGTNDRGLFGGGYGGGYQDTIEYVTISTPGNVIDFGDLTISRYLLSSTSNGINDRGIFGGGNSSLGSDIIDYVTISSPGNATDFGDLSTGKRVLAACSNGINNRGVFGGGSTTTYTDTIEYVTMIIPGDAVDFGDLTVAKGYLAACSDG